MKILYFDCFSGMSGDMVIGALLDAGANADMLVEELSKLDLADEYEITWKKVNKQGITSTKFDVMLKNDEQLEVHHHNHRDSQHGHHDNHHKHQHRNHVRQHDHEEHYAHADQHAHHDHDHAHNGHHHHNHAHHRTYRHIVELIQNAALTDNVKTIAINIFTKIAKAEGRIHGVPMEDVHFHEVGAVDSIIDIVGTAILIDQLKVDRIISSPIPVGSGKIRIDHGIYPVPAPATLEILRGIPLAASNIKGELTTPTGAAIASVLSKEFGPMPSMTVDTIGYGAGTKDIPNHPNVLRVVIGQK